MSVVSRPRLFVYAVLAAGLTGAAVAAALATAPAASGAPSCTITWTGAVSTDWDTAGNWSPARVPTTTDVACMSATPTRSAVVLSSTATVRSVVFGLSSSSLSLASTLTVTEPAGTANTSAVNNLALGSGVWRGSVAVTGLTSAGGTFAAGTVTLAGTSTVNGLQLSETATVTNQGALTWNSSTNYIDVYNGSKLVNGSTGSVTITGNGSAGIDDSGDTGDGFVNAGTLTFNLSSTATTVNVQTRFANTGTVIGTKGTVNAGGGSVTATPDTGSYQLANGTVFAFGGGTRTVSTITATGGGAIGVTNGATTIAAGSVANLLLTGGTLGSTTGNGFGIGALNTPVSSSGRIVGPGTVTITGTGTGAAATSILDHLSLDSGANLVNQGVASWNSSNNYLEFTGGSSFTNGVGGSFTVTGNGTYSIYDNDGDTANRLVDAGSLTLNLASTTNTVTINVPFAHTGTVIGTKGAASATGGGVTGTPDTGSYQLANATVFAFAGGTRTVSTITATGQGAIGVSGGATTIAAGSVSNLLLTGGTIGSTTGNGFGIGALNAPVSSSGRIVGPGTVTITGTGTGAATTSILDHLSLDSGANLVNQGIATWNSTTNYLEFSGGSTFTNAGSFTVIGNSAYSVYDNDGDTANRIVDSGTLTVNLATGANPVLINVAFANTGTVIGTKGTANATAGGVTGTPDTGSYQMANGAVFAFAGGTRTVSTITATGQGAVGIAGGATTVAAGNIANLLVTGGTVGSTTGGGFGIGALNTSTNGNGRIVGPGTVTITGTGAGAAASSVLDHVSLDGGANLVNQAVGVWNSTNNYLEFAGGSTFTNAVAGSITIVGNGSYSVYDNDGDAGNKLVNAGSLTVNLGASGNTLSDAVSFTNTGTVTATRGTFSLAIVTNLSTAGTLTGGTWNAPTGTITLPREVASNKAVVAIGATGQILSSSTGTAAFIPLASNSGSFTSGRSLTTTTSLTNTGTLVVAGGTLRATTVTQTAGTTTVATGAVLRSGSAGTAAVTISGGTLQGTGTVQGAVSVSGTVSPGTSGAGSLAVTGTLALKAAGKLAVTAGTAATSVVATGAVTAAGTLAITPGPATPAIGTSVTVLSGSARTGTFATVTGVDVPAAGGYWVVGYTATSVTLTLTAYPTASVTNVTVAEGNSGTSNAVFTVTLSAASPVQATVAYATSDGSASAGSDYTATTGTLTFAPGTTSQTITVPIIGDTLYENDETFTLTMSAPSGSTIASGSATGTITNDDTAPALSVADASGATSAAGGGTVTFPVTLNAPSGLPVTVQYATVNGTAVAGTDYTAASGTLTIPAGQTSATVSVALTTIATYAPDKTFTLVLSNPVGATLADGSATGTIVNGNPNGPTVADVFPGQGAQGTAVAVTVNGTGFGAGSTVAVSGTGVTVSGVTVVDPTRITATFTLAGTAPTGARDVTVTSAGLSDTCTGCFTVTPRPTVTSPSRTAFAQGNVDAVLTVSGSTFTPGSSLTLTTGTKTFVDATSVSVSSSTSLTAVVSLPITTAVGSYNIVVTNPDGGVGTCSRCVNVYAAPKLTTVSPATVARGSAMTMTFTGSGFVAGALVSVPGCTTSNVTVVNATTITATVTPNASATTGAKTVRIINPTTAGSGTGAKANAVTIT